MQDNRLKGWRRWLVVGCLAPLISVACATNAENPPPEAGPRPGPAVDSDTSERLEGPGSGHPGPSGEQARSTLGVMSSSQPAPRAADTAGEAPIRRCVNGSCGAGTNTATTAEDAGAAEPAPARRLVPPTLPEDIARAKRLLARGAALYRRGDYEPAEEALKEAMTLYPFLADANLLLGKIFLIRGAASLDRSLIDHARLMFEMARKLDPNLAETDLLLELFAPPARK